MSNNDASQGNSLMTPGTWLAEVPRDRTLDIVQQLNLIRAGMGHVRDRILVGNDANGEEPTPGHPRVDTVSATAKVALNDLILLRDITATTIHAVAAAAIGSGADPDTVLKWAHYDADDRALIDGVADLLNQQEPNHQPTDRH